jgi:2-keto-3-deoxy-6-phosphogluconate aldolase
MIAMIHAREAFEGRDAGSSVLDRFPAETCYLVEMLV